MPLKNTRKIGNLGEEFAENFLKKSGYKILKKNLHLRFGEIDIICTCEQKKYLVFVEVKCRKNLKFDCAGTSISFKKFKRMSLAAENFANKKIYINLIPRLDLLFIKIDKKNMLQSIQHFKAIEYDQF